MVKDNSYNKFIKRPSNSNALIYVSLTIGFIILIISQYLLFRATTQERARVSSSARDASGSQADSVTVLTSSALQLTACAVEDVQGAVARAKPWVVNIDITSNQVGPSGRGGPALDFDMPSSGALRANDETLGSGIIVDKNGFILTCLHLIKGYPEVYVTLFSAGRKIYKAEVAAADPACDLALLRIYPDVPIPVAKLGNSAMVNITDEVFTIGSPFGFEHTVTSGIISDNERSLIIEGVVYEDLLQTDAALNRGSAGGALINTTGEVIGINTAIVSDGDYFSGVSFAIPVNKARPLLLEAAFGD